MAGIYFSYIGKKLLFIQLQTVISYYQIVKTNMHLIIDLWVCEVPAKLTQYIGDKQRV